MSPFPLSWKRAILRRASVPGGSLVAIGLILSLLLTPTAIGQDETTDDAKAVQGTWTPIKAELAGTAWPDAVLKTIVLKMDAGKYEASVAGRLDKGTYSQDVSARPKRLTIRGTDGPNAGKTYPCIYELSGDTLRVCYDLSGEKAPIEFATAPGTKLYLVTYMRERD